MTVDQGDFMVVREYPGGRKHGWPFVSRTEAEAKYAKEAGNHPSCRIHLIDRALLVSLDTKVLLQRRQP